MDQSADEINDRGRAWQNKQTKQSTATKSTRLMGGGTSRSGGPQLVLYSFSDCAHRMFSVGRTSTNKVVLRDGCLSSQSSPIRTDCVKFMIKYTPNVFVGGHRHRHGEHPANR